MDKKLNEAVAALRPQMVAALQRLVRRRSVEADPLPGKPFGEEVDACFTEALTLCHELGFETRWISLDKSFKIDYTTNRKGADEQCLVSFPFLVDQKRLTV